VVAAGEGCVTRIQTISAPDRTIVRFVDDEGLNHVLEASEDADRAQARYRGIFVMTFCLVVVAAIQLYLKIEAGLILRGVLFAYVLQAALHGWERWHTGRRYRRLRDAWWEATKDDPDRKETPSDPR
jgi:hypothetical protein